MQTMRAAQGARLASLLVGTAFFAAVCSGAAHAEGVDKALHDAVPAKYRDAGVKVAAFNDWPPDEWSCAYGIQQSGGSCAVGAPFG